MAVRRDGTHLALLSERELSVLPLGEAAHRRVGKVEAVARRLPQARRRLGEEERAVLLVDHAECEKAVRVEV